MNIVWNTVVCFAQLLEQHRLVTTLLSEKLDVSSKFLKLSTICALTLWTRWRLMKSHGNSSFKRTNYTRIIDSDDYRNWWNIYFLNNAQSPIDGMYGMDKNGRGNSQR